MADAPASYVATNLPELHDEVEEVRGGLLASSAGGAVGLALGVLEEVVHRDALPEAVVQPLLPGGEVAGQVDLDLREGGKGRSQLS